MNAPLVIGLLLLGGCVFTAGWVTRAQLEQPLKTWRARRARRRWTGRGRGGMVGGAR